MQTKTSFIARYAETDQMGIVHHSNYPIWFEAGRTDYLRKTGTSNSSIEADGMLLPLSEMYCNFKTPAKYEEEIIVSTKIGKMSCVRIEFEYEVLNGTDGKLLATGRTVHAWTDKALKPLNLQKKAPKVYSILENSIE